MLQLKETALEALRLVAQEQTTKLKSLEEQLDDMKTAVLAAKKSNDCEAWLVSLFLRFSSTNMGPVPERLISANPGFSCTFYIYLGSLYVSGKQPTYPSPKPTSTLTSHIELNVG